MRRKVQVPLFSGEEPPAELLRYPLPAVGGYAGFEDWLRARRHWRQTHGLPLPTLFARDRFALHRITSLDPALVRDELAAPKALPEWAARAQAKRFRPSADTGLLPEVARPSEAPMGAPAGGAE